jgi:hypothetical protein
LAAVDSLAAISLRDLGGAGSMDGIIAESFSPEMPRSSVFPGTQADRRKREWRSGPDSRACIALEDAAKRCPKSENLFTLGG